MVSEELWKSLIENLDDPITQAQALSTLRARLKKEGSAAETRANEIAPRLADLKTQKGRELALALVQPYARNVPVVVDMALEMSKDEAPATRSNAASVLFGLVENPRVRTRVVEMVSDPDENIRINVMKALEEIDFTPQKEAGEAGFFVIANEDDRSTAAEILDEMERAIKTLEDLGLDDAQHRIVDELLLPKLGTLRSVLKTSYVDVVDVAAETKNSVIGVGTLVGGAKALLLAISGAANAEPAAEAVADAAEGLASIISFF